MLWLQLTCSSLNFAELTGGNRETTTVAKNLWQFHLPPSSFRSFSNLAIRWQRERRNQNAKWNYRRPTPYTSHLRYRYTAPRAGRLGHMHNTAIDNDGLLVVTKPDKTRTRPSPRRHQNQARKYHGNVEHGTPTKRANKTIKLSSSSIVYPWAFVWAPETS